MTCAIPARLVVRAIAHGVVACTIVIGVALLWPWLPGGRDAASALATVGGIGAVVWSGARIAARSRSAANDNHPCDPPVLTWTPLAGPQATVRALLR